jgi:acyl-CoA synthetase (AMP-forming)/AMP-acid ligase II
LQYYALDHQVVNANKDVALGVLPFFHIFGLTLLLHSVLYMGIPLHVMPRFDLVQFCETVQKEKISFTALVPPIILLLAKNPLIDQYDLSSIKLVICGAAPLGVELSQQVKKRIPTMIVKQGYGLTETSPCAIVEPTNRVIDGKADIVTYDYFQGT